MSIHKIFTWTILILLIAPFSCTTSPQKVESLATPQLPVNMLDYQYHTFENRKNQPLAFSDQGAWMAYSLPSSSSSKGTFIPYLMTQENGKWMNPNFCQLHLGGDWTWENFEYQSNAYNSHLEQIYTHPNLVIKMSLFFSSGHTAYCLVDIKNTSERSFFFEPHWTFHIPKEDFELINQDGGLALKSKKSTASCYLYFDNKNELSLHPNEKWIDGKTTSDIVELKAGENKQISLSQTFIFPEYDWTKEQSNIAQVNQNPKAALASRQSEKYQQWEQIAQNLAPKWTADTYKNLLAKCLLTLQNNWRIPAGELQHSGLFPSYHYEWFHGFWAWDSWKHAVALAQYDVDLAKEQILAMYDFEDDKGFIADCVYRDTMIEKHNYRNTKPPLSAWAAWSVYEQDADLGFLKKLYSKIQLQHDWWYQERDVDRDSICEYGSTDGTLIAAKWESGMDNAVRFDSSQIVSSSPTAHSLNQESVDLNAYLYAEKLYLAKIAEVLDLTADNLRYQEETNRLKEVIQTQFFDEESGWFYDTSLDGKQMIKVRGCEGWIPLWAKAASPSQAEAVKNNMMNNKYFFTKVPFQTLSAAHPKFKPNRGYWRGPNWLDQAYFGVKALHNYGFHEEAHAATHRLVHHADGLLETGPSIRENYQPITGEGMESKSFSWSAAHYLLLLLQ